MTIHKIEEVVKRFVYRKNYFVNGYINPSIMLDATFCDDNTIERIAAVMGKARSRIYDKFGNRIFTKKGNI